MFAAFYPHMSPYSCCGDDQNMTIGTGCDVTTVSLVSLQIQLWATTFVNLVTFYITFDVYKLSMHTDISFVEPLCYNECGIVTDLVSLATIY